MTLLLTIEQGPRPQAVRQKRLESGELVIGRGADAGWQIDDPDMFVSRAHCRIGRRPDGYVVTDMSSSGLFIDDAAAPLGQGNSAVLEDGMRLRLGDYVVGVDLSDDAPERSEPFRPAADAFVQSPPVRPAAPSASGGFAGVGSDDFFSARTEEEPRAPRPASLPDPFEKPVPGAFSRASEPLSQAFDDPFSLDPVSGSPEGQTPPPSPAGGDPFDFSGFAPDASDAAGGQSDSASPAFGDFGFEPAPAPNVAKPSPAALYLRGEDPARETLGNPPAAAPGEAKMPPAAAFDAPAPRAVGPAPAAEREASSDLALRAAFLRGMGVAEAGVPGMDPVAEMERLGREYRLMMDGLMQLLRKRAEEKGNARVAQTVVGMSEVNPLKFLPTVDDAIVMILSGRSAGFLNGEAAIKDSVRDLAHHHVRAWRGVQAALRRMIDRFDPAAIEAELKAGSSIGGMLPGSRGARLWELYCKRHKEIAQSVETRFLGEVGADFRDAYEEG